MGEGSRVEKKVAVMLGVFCNFLASEIWVGQDKDVGAIGS